MMSEAIDYTALNWVRHELNEKLMQARQCLEKFAETPGNTEPLKECISSLHQARGTLHMVELQGADRLASEMEGVLNALIQERIEPTEATLEILMQAFIQLPDYLSRLRTGRREVPVVLLPLINRLRAVCGQEPLPESVIFSPDLTIPVPAACFNSQVLAELPDVRELARTYRQRFQTGLVEWYRGGKNSSGLHKLHEVLASLQQASRHEAAARLWWFGAGLSEALTKGVLPPSTDIKQLFGRIERQLKRLIDVGEADFSGTIPEDLLKLLLFHILQADTSAGRVGDIREIYTPRESDRCAAAESLAGRNEELLNSVSVAASERLEQIKTRLDDFMRTGMGEPTDLSAIADDMHGLGNTVGMIGMEHAGRILAEHERIARAMIEGGQPVDASGLMRMADAMLAVEVALRDVHLGEAALVQPETTQDLAYRQGLDAVSREIVTDMTDVRERIDNYIKMPDRREVLAGVPVILDRVRGSLLLAEQERAAGLVTQICDYISQELIAAAQVPDDRQLDTLADAICSIEYYVEALKETPIPGGRLLDVAEQSLANLVYSSVPGGKQARAGQAGRVAVPSTDHPDVPDAPVITALQVIADDVDSEILDVFIEEAEEEIALLARLLPLCMTDAGNGEMLETIRRAFHTLKGSGRMVGAMALGEFAWSFERLLKQFMDASAGTGEEQLKLLARVTGPLSQLLEQIKGGPAPEADVNDLVVQAVRLTHPGTPQPDRSVGEAPVATNPTAASGTVDAIEATPAVHECINAADAAAVTVTVINELPVLSQNADPEIVEIFLEEAADELAAISENLPQWINDPRNQEALATVRRAFHTLKGSGRMAGAMVVGEFAWAIESLLNRVIDGSIEVSGDLMAFLGQVSTPLSELISQVNGGAEPVADFRAVMEAAQKLTRGECITLPAPSVEAGITGSPAGVATQSGVFIEDGEPELLEIFGRECRDHLNSMRTFIDGCEHDDNACHVSEPLYRALHTLAGIAESAQVPFIKMLAGEIYSYFGAVEEAQQPAGRDAVEVLRACTTAMSGLVDRLPDITYDAQLLQSLQERIRCLPRVDAGERPSGEGALFQDVPQEEPVEANGGDTGPVPYTAAPTVAVEPAAAADLATPVRAVDHYAHLDAELLEVFLEEAGEIIESSETTLHAWVEDPGHRELINEFQRQLHTLKGGARMVDITAIGNLSHSLETLLTRVVDGHVETSDQLFGLLQHAHDRLADMFEKVKAREVPDNAEALVAQLNRLGHEDEAAVAEVTVADVAGQVESEVSTQTGQENVAPLAQDRQDIAGALDEPVAAVVFDAVDQVLAGESPPDTLREGEVMPRQPERRKASRVRGEQVRVQAELLDSLVNYAGEINIYRARLDQQIGVYRFNLAELHQTINRVRDQLRQFEIETETQILHRFERETDDRNLDFDPLEMDRYSNLQQLSRSLVETISDLHSIQELLDNTTRETELLLLQQARVNTDLQEGLMRARMIPFAGLAPRLRRIVRQAAEELGKKVELTLDGADGEMDRNVIERIIAPLEHMLRNAVDHGIEQPGQRREAGKPETGTVRIAFHREGPEIVLQVTDDGRGINHEAVRERAIERGLIAEHAQLSDSEIMQFVVQTGFSTAAKVTQISGRGVGMDVVNSEVKQLGGSLHIASSPGRGSIFTIRLPYTLAINQALLVRAGEDTYCVPLGTIEGVVRVDAEFLSECYKTRDASYRYAGNAYQLHHLGTLLKRGSMNLAGAKGRIPVLLARIGEKRLALQVEALIGNREIVVKPLGAQLSSVHGVSGATILGDGRVVLILDMAAVGRMAVKPQAPSMAAERSASERLLVMVVDDSITVRKVTTRLLERYGFDVMTAKDGVDAMSLLQDRIPDVMLLDIEMPRMDGFELARHVRSDERLRHIPITIITSRTGDKHRERAMQIGVNHYLGKPFQEHELLKTIHRLIGIPMMDEQDQADVYGQA